MIAVCCRLLVLFLLAGAAHAGSPADRARNVILFIGDGMGISTVTAARILAGQQRGATGEEHRLSFDTLPATALVRVFTANQQVPDSAPTATALVTGQLANDRAVSVGPGAARDLADEARLAPHRLETLLEQAEARGLATGIVTTTRVTHATPAVNYAHTPNRGWERAGQMPAGATLPDIAAQLVQRQRTGDGIEVVLGGGRQMFLPKAVADPEYPDLRGQRTDDRNLVTEWLAAQAGSAFVYDRAGFAALDLTRTRKLLGLFEPSHLHYEVDRAGDRAGEPSLAEMTRTAIRVLARNRRGYFLMVEGGRIDHAHHAGNAWRALTETIALSEAVAAALELVDPRATLVLVTADHSHPLTLAGYAARGNPILGLVREDPQGPLSRDWRGQPYATLSYANGRGQALLPVGGEARAGLPITPGRVADLGEIDTTDQGFHQEALVGLPAGTHAGEDVALYGWGAGSNLVRGTLDQPDVYRIMRRALGW
ncbi:MAG: alkaline phosphatase [Gammaproteobacteria bacterium]|nr:alkaline phosphatase [Gammaproteobacteria bacterium]